MHNIPTSCYCSITFPNPSHPLPLSAFPDQILHCFSLPMELDLNLLSSRFLPCYLVGSLPKVALLLLLLFLNAPFQFDYFGMSSSRGQRTQVTFPNRFTSTWNGSKAKRSSTEAFVAVTCSEVKKLDIDFLPLEGERINNKC